MQRDSHASAGGRHLICRIDDKPYPKGVTVSDAELEAIDLTQDGFHGE
jgi:hypothetical protein